MNWNLATLKVIDTEKQQCVQRLSTIETRRTCMRRNCLPVGVRRTDHKMYIGTLFRNSVLRTITLEWVLFAKLLRDKCE